jgi:hypothetical protein
MLKKYIYIKLLLILIILICISRNRYIANRYIGNNNYSSRNLPTAKILSAGIHRSPTPETTRRAATHPQTWAPVGNLLRGGIVKSKT